MSKLYKVGGCVRDKILGIKTKYVKLCDEDGNLVYNLTLPNGDTVQYTDPNLAMYVHSLERRLGVK